MTCAFSSIAAAEGELVNCFDYYKFGSVDVNLSTPLPSTVNGVALNFSGEIRNNNGYPIPGAKLYVKLFRENRVNPTQLGDLVDTFTVVENVSLPANDAIPVSFNWDVPVGAVSGDYKLATFIISADRFNLSGLSFTDDIVGKSVTFSINSDHKGHIQFDKDTVDINGLKSNFASYPVRVPDGRPAKLSLDVVSSFATPTTANITWNVYKWDAQNPRNLIETSVQTLSLTPQQRKKATLEISDTSASVYLVEGIIQNSDTKSIVQIRFVRPGQNEIRLNFPSLTDFPPTPQSKMFACFHSTSDTGTQNATVKMTLRDRAGKTLDQAIYQGAITGEMMGYAKTLALESYDVDSLTLTTELLDGDQLVDTIQTSYGCASSNSKACTATANNTTPLPSTFSTITQITELSRFAYVIVATIIVALLSVGLLLYRRRYPHQ